MGVCAVRTRLHNKWYDLSSFQHPGGPVALGLSNNRDATALFESHHPFLSRDRLRKILSKYEIEGPSEGSAMTLLTNPPYEWDGVDNDAFTCEVKQHVNEHFAAIAERRGVSVHEATKATPARWLLIWTLIAVFVSTLPPFVSGNYAFLLVTPLAAWLAVVNMFHDACHFALSTNWRVNAAMAYLLPLLSSPWLWYHHHVIGHHAYTNIGRKDPDLAHTPQLMREHESVRWRKQHATQACASRIFLVWAIASSLGLNILNDIRAIKKLSYNNVVSIDEITATRMAVHVLGRILYVFLTAAWPFVVFDSFWKAVVFSTVPNMVFSLVMHVLACLFSGYFLFSPLTSNSFHVHKCFMGNTQINHLSEACAHASSPNFYKHQIVTAQNFGNGSLFCYYFSGGLNYQIEHHLFPTVNHCHLPALSHGIKRICKKHGVPYNHAAGYGEAFSAHLAHTRSLSLPPPQKLQ